MNPIHRLKSIYRDLETIYLDFKLGINTREIIEAKDIVTDSPNKQYSRAAKSCSYRSIKVILREAKKRGWVGCDFCDIGSGLGRVCFYASTLRRFRFIYGFELSSYLNTRANENQRSFRRTRWRDYFPILVCRDAAVDKILPGKNLIFMYHPFETVILDKFLTNNKEALKNSCIAYVNYNQEVEWCLSKHGMRPVWADPKWKLSLWEYK